MKDFTNERFKFHAVDRVFGFNGELVNISAGSCDNEFAHNHGYRIFRKNMMADGMKNRNATMS